MSSAIPMEITDNDRAYLKKALSTNAAILFVGAGFSASATNKLRQSIPVGNEFATTPTEFAERWLRLGKIIEPGCQFAVEGLFGDVAALVEWIEGVGEAIVKFRQTRNLLPKEVL